MIYAETPGEIATRRKAFLREWRLKCQAVTLFSDAGTACRAAIERLNEEFHRRVKTQTVLPCAYAVSMLLWVLMASGRIIMRKVDGWETLARPFTDTPLDQAARSARNSPRPEARENNFCHFQDTTRINARNGPASGRCHPTSRGHISPQHRKTSPLRTLNVKDRGANPLGSRKRSVSHPILATTGQIAANMLPSMSSADIVENLWKWHGLSALRWCVVACRY